jgi:hypothetical protein
VIPTEIRINDTSLTETELVSLVDHILASWIGLVKTFYSPTDASLATWKWSLPITKISGFWVSPVVHWMYLFLIFHTSENYRMPINLQRCASLRTLKLRFCSLEPSKNVSLIGFKNLVNLHLNNVKIRQDSFDTIIKGCTKLESLWIQEFRGFTQINLQVVH